MPKRPQIEDRGPRSFHYSHYQTRGSRGAGLTNIFDAYASERYESDDSLDETADELQQLLVKLNKRDSVTRQKALDTLLESLPGISNSAIGSKLKDFVVVFKRLVVVEPMKNVRIQLAELLQAIVKRIGKKMTKHISSLLPWWWIAMHDESPNVAQAYSEAFKSAFTKNTDPNLLELKVAKVLALYMDDLATTYFYIMTRDQVEFKKDWIDVFGNMCDKPVTLVEMHKRLLTATYESMTGLLERYRKYSQQPLESTRAASAGAVVNQEFIHLISGVCIKNCPESFRQCRAALKLLIQMVKFVGYVNNHITQLCFKIGTEACVAQCHDEHLLLLSMKLVLCCCMYNGDIYNARGTLADLLPRILGHIKGDVSTRIEMYSVLTGLMTQLDSSRDTMTNGLPHYARVGIGVAVERGDAYAPRDIFSGNEKKNYEGDLVQKQSPGSTSPRDLYDHSLVIEGLAQGLVAKMKQHIKDMSYYGSYTFSQPKFQQLGASMLCCYYKLLMQLSTWDSRAASLVCLPLQLVDQDTEPGIVFLHELPRIFTEFVEDCYGLENNITASTLVLQGLQEYEHCVLLVGIYCQLVSPSPCSSSATTPKPIPLSSPVLTADRVGNIIKDGVLARLPDLLDILYSHTLPQLVKDLINDCNNSLIQMKIDQLLDLCKTNHAPNDKFASLSELPRLLSQAKLELKDFQLCYSFLLKIFSSLPLSGDAIATDTLTSACIAAVCCNTSAVAANKVDVGSSGIIRDKAQGDVPIITSTINDCDSSAKMASDDQRIELARNILVQRPTGLSDPLAIHVARDFLDRCGKSIAYVLSNEMIDFCHGSTLDQSLAITVLEHVDPSLLDGKHKGSLYILYMALRLTKCIRMDSTVDVDDSRASRVYHKLRDLVPLKVVQDLTSLYFCGVILKCNMDFNHFVRAAEMMYDYRLKDLDAYSVAREAMAITSADVKCAFSSMFPLDDEPLQTGKFDDVIECSGGSFAQATTLLHSALKFVTGIHGTDAARAASRAADVLASLWLEDAPAHVEQEDFSGDEDEDEVDDDDTSMEDGLLADKDEGKNRNHQFAGIINRHDSNASCSNSTIAARIPLDNNDMQLLNVWITCMLHMKNAGTFGFKRLSTLLYKQRQHDIEVAKLYIVLALDMPPFLSPEDLCDGMKKFQDFLKRLGFKSIPIPPLVELLEFVHEYYPCRLFAGYFGASIYNVCHGQIRRVDAIPKLKSATSGADGFVELANHLAEAASRLRLALQPSETWPHLVDYVTTYARGILQCITAQGTRVPQFCSSDTAFTVIYNAEDTSAQDGDRGHSGYYGYHHNDYVYYTFWLNCSLLDFFTVANECIITNGSHEMSTLVDICSLWATGSLIWAHDNLDFAPSFGLVARLLEFFLDYNMVDAAMLTLETSPDAFSRKSLERAKLNLKFAHLEQCNTYLCGVKASSLVPILPAYSALMFLVDIVENLQEHSEWVVSCVDKYMQFLFRVQNLYPGYVFALCSKLWSSPLLGDMYKYSELFCKYLEHPGVLGLPEGFTSAMLDSHLPSMCRGDAFINLKVLFDSVTEHGDVNTSYENTLVDTCQLDQMLQQDSSRTVDLGSRIRSMYLALAFGPVMYRHLMDIFRLNAEPNDLCASLNAWLTALSSCERLMLKCHSRSYEFARWLLNATPGVAQCEWETLRGEIELGVRLQCSNMYWWLDDLDNDEEAFGYANINKSGVCALLERIIELCSTDDEIPFQTIELLFRLGRLFPGELNLATILHYKRHDYGEDQQSSGLGLKKLAHYYRYEVTRRLIASELEHCDKIKTDALQLHVNNEYNKIIATTSAREVAIKVEIKIPPTFPMEPASVTLCDDAFRFRTKLQRLLMLAQSEINKSGIAQGILLWHSNLVRFFEGISECTICFSIVHVQFQTIPAKVCKVCKHKFHGECLYKWFRNAPKPKCPLCQSTGSFNL